MKPELRTIVLVLSLALMAGACGGSKTAEQGTAAGEVLPGSISDAMLPLDSVRSEPPLADPVEAKGGDDKLDKSVGDRRSAAKNKTDAAAGSNETTVPSEPSSEPSAPEPAASGGGA